MNSVHNETMPDESLSLAFLGKALALVFVVLVIANGLLFIFYYGDTFTPLALPYRETFENRWRLDYRQFGGQWHLRDNALVQSDTQDTDLLAVIPLTIPPEQHYRFGTQLKILQGPNGGGLMFNLQHPNSRQQSHLVRFGNADGKDYLVFGYFDENLQFVAQGSLLPPDLTQGVELAVLVHDQSYDVLVNGQPQQLEIPLQYKGGNLALTTWFSSVTFDDVYVTALSETPDKSATQPIQTTVITENTSTGVAEPVVINASAGITQPMRPVDDNRCLANNFSITPIRPCGRL